MFIKLLKKQRKIVLFNAWLIQVLIFWDLGCMIICIARIFTSIGEIVFELTLCFLGQHVLCLFTNITMKKNSYYREALRINIMCVVTNFKKAA